MSERHKNTKSCDFEIILAFVMVIHNHKKREIDLILFYGHKDSCHKNFVSAHPSGQNHADSAGNPWGWWILGGGESPEKFGL